MALVRAFAVLDPDRTPCGQPLSPSAAHVLTELSGDRVLSQTELSSRLRLEKSTISRLVGQLEERGWMGRCRAERDGRVMLLALTEEGRAMAERIAASRAAFFTRLCERIPPARRGELLMALELLVGALDESR
jgi:DNA-binding MarR family transcriptional regulator